MVRVVEVLTGLVPVLLAVGGLSAAVVCVGWPRMPYRSLYDAALLGCVAGLFGLAIAIKTWATLQPATSGGAITVAALTLAALVRAQQTPGPLSTEERERIAAMTPAQRKELLGGDDRP